MLGIAEPHYARYTTASSVILVPGLGFTQPADRFTVDVAMSRVKFNVNTEYAYIQNFKILQSTQSNIVLSLHPEPPLTV